MNDIISNRGKIYSKIKKYKDKIYDLEYRLIDLEREVSDIDNSQIVESLSLNNQQKKIVEFDTVKENILVLACPGSGKTHTLISRYINLIVNYKINPEKIILITFTKKAGQELEDRLKKIIPTHLPFYVGSLHGLAYKLIKKFNNCNYTILDDVDSKKLLKDTADLALQVTNLEEEDLLIIKSNIIIIVDQLSAEYSQNLKKILMKMNLENYENIFKRIITMYQETKKKQNIIDFNDLMTLLAKLLSTQKVKEFINSIEYIFFDEYQDINPIQNHILCKFTSSNIMVVGDDAQSIYKFRGSDIKFILNFEKKFTPSKIFYLEQNYRSTEEIINFCQNIIINNKNQYNKKVQSLENNKGVKPMLYVFDDNNEEQYKWICKDIIKLVKNKNVLYSDIVILSRKNSNLNRLEYHLHLNHIPVLKHLGISLLDKSYVKDFLAFITIINNNKSIIHWKRVLALHPKIGIANANNIIDFGGDVRNSIKVLIKQTDFYYNNINNFDKILDQIESSSTTSNKIKLIIPYLENLWKENNYKNIEDNIKEIKILLNYLNYDDNKSLDEFINDLYLKKEIDTINNNSVYLSTIHGSKGLEWKYVYIIDMDNNTFPSIIPKFYIDELDEMEEERRLFYVAASRAKQSLIITCNINKSIDRMKTLSPLLKELDDKNFIYYGAIDDEIKLNNKINSDIFNLIKYNGTLEFRDIIYSLKYDMYTCTNKLITSSEVKDLKYKIILNNFLKYTINKMILVNFSKFVKKIDLDLFHIDNNFNKKIYYNYIDPLIDWRNSLDDILYISTYTSCKKNMDKDTINKYKNFLLGEYFYKFLIDIEKNLVKYIKNNSPNEIYIEYKINNDNFAGEIDLLIDNNIIMIKPSLNNNFNLIHLLQNLFIGCIYKNTNLKNISIYNPIYGKMLILKVKNFNFENLKTKIY